MIDIEIESTGERLLMSIKDRLRVTFQSSDLRDAGTSASSFSTSAKLALTSENVAKLGFKTVQSIQPSDSVIIKARLLTNDNELDKGFIRIDSIDKTNKEIGITFFGRNADWFSQLKGKEIRDIDFSMYDHVNSSANINVDRTEGYIYLPVDYGYLTSKTSAVIEVNEIFPALFVRDLIKHIFKGAGYKVRGTLFERPEMDRLLIPFSGETPVHSNDWIASHTLIATGLGVAINSLSTFFQVVYGQQLSTSDTKLAFGRVGITGTISPLEGDYSTGTYTYTATEPMELNTSINIATKLVGLFDVNVIITLYHNGVLFATAPYFTGGINYTFPTLTLAEGDTLELYGRLDSFAIKYIVMSSVGNPAYKVSDRMVSSWLVKPTKKMVAGSIYQMSWFLPKLKQRELIEYIFFIFNVLVSFDAKTNAIVIDTVNDLNIANSEDWSDKLDLSNQVESNYFDFLNNYARKNSCEYEQDEDNALCEQYLSDWSIGFGDGSLDINNEYLDTEKEFYKAPFLPCTSGQVFTGISGMQMWMPALFQKDNAAAYILYYCPNISVSEMSNGVLSYVTIAGVNKTHIPYAYFVSPIDTIDDPLINNHLCFRLPIDRQYSGLSVLDKNYRKIESVLNNCETISASFFLTPLEIANVQFNKLKHVESLSGYYYLNQIGQYDGNGSSVECELIKWN